MLSMNSSNHYPCINSWQKIQRIPSPLSRKNHKTGFSCLKKKTTWKRATWVRGRREARDNPSPSFPSSESTTTHRWILQFSSRAGTGQCGRSENLFYQPSPKAAQKSFCCETRTALSGNGFLPARMISWFEVNTIIAWRFIRFPPRLKRIESCVL